MEMPSFGSSSSSSSPHLPTTTFVHADPAAFKELVQRLTGPSAHDTSADFHYHHHPPSSPTARPPGVKRPMFKLHERRPAGYRPKLTIMKPNPNPLSASPGILSPSSDMAGLCIGDKDSPAASTNVGLNPEEEEKAIKERRFYLHPSPRRNAAAAAPELLSLFPLASPKSRQFH
ncbi:VQ motif-containing protein 31-like [Typha angustifolia]|uniref:VQ motif-containing protein 31-like n=1 Tax=Typha angustifolia TaxID=59011 RepID=UPI003C2F7BE3